LDSQATLTHWAKVRPKSVPRITHYQIAWEDADALAEDGAIDEADVLIIDTPPSIEAQPKGFARLLKAAELVLVPVRPTFDDATSAGPFLQYLREQDSEVVAVLNAVKPRVNINRVKGYLLKVAELAPVEIADRTDYARAGEQGLGLVDAKGHPGAHEIAALWEFVRTRVWGRQYVAA
jgi:chromosome partitioning protein